MLSKAFPLGRLGSRATFEDELGCEINVLPVAECDAGSLMNCVTYEKADKHNREIHENRKAWARKPVLRRVYGEFYRAICQNLEPSLPGIKVELGSGMGNIRTPSRMSYHRSFPQPLARPRRECLSIELPGCFCWPSDLVRRLASSRANALAEFRRVLVPKGRVILLEPAMSLVGRLVYGKCHHEPLGFDTLLSDRLTDLNAPYSTRYFAAQSSVHRIFVRRELPRLLDGWEFRTIRPITSFAYLGSGGFRGPQLYPQAFYQVVKLADRILGLAPSLFAARLLVCISKKP